MAAGCAIRPPGRGLAPDALVSLTGARSTAQRFLNGVTFGNPLSLASNERVHTGLQNATRRKLANSTYNFIYIATE